MLRRDVELLAAGLARDRIVDADHVVAQLRVERAIAFVGACGQTVLLRAHDPPHLIVVDALAARAAQLVGPRLVPVVEEVAFVERHPAIILSFTHGARSRTHLSERAAVAGAAADGRVSADAAAARDQPSAVDRRGEPRARGRPAALPRA